MLFGYLDIWTLGLGVIVFLVVKFYLETRKPKEMPPGPMTWPFIGNLNHIYNGDRFHMKAFGMGKRFNGMFSKF